MVPERKMEYGCLRERSLCLNWWELYIRGFLLQRKLSKQSKVSIAFQIPKMLGGAHCPIYSHYMGEKMYVNIQRPVGQSEFPYETWAADKNWHVKKNHDTTCQSVIFLGIWRPYYVALFSAWAKLSSGPLLNVQLSSFFFDLNASLLEISLLS